MLTKVEPFFDDFDDRTVSGWTGLDWSASNGFRVLLESSADFTSIYRSNTDADLEMQYRYFTSTSGYWGQVYFRFDDFNNYAVVQMTDSKLRLFEKVGGTTTVLDENTSAPTATSTWYTVRIVADGSDITVYRSEDGEMEEEVLSATTSQLTTSRVQISNGAGSDYVYNDVRIVSDDLNNTTTFAVNNANEMTSATGPNGTTSYTYDDWGRTSTRSLGSYTTDYAWRYGSFLEEFDSDFPGEGTVSYLTGGDGLRRQRTHGSDVTWYNWSGYDVINEEDDAGTLTRTYWGRNFAHSDGSNPATGTYAYYLRDHISSTRSLYDDSDALSAEYAYSPFGSLYAGTKLDDTTHLYTGHALDPATGQYFAPFRYYNPSAARWLKRDPLGMIDGPNLYEYVNSNSVNGLDALGLHGPGSGWVFPYDPAKPPLAWDPSIPGEMGKGGIAGVDGAIPFIDPFEDF